MTGLDMHPIDSADTASSMTPESEEVEVLMQSLLPSPAEILTDSFFRSPTFALVPLLKVAKFYGSLTLQDQLHDCLLLSDADRYNKIIAAHVWFADFIGCDSGTILACVARYKMTHCATDPIQSYCFVPTGGSRPDIVAQDRPKHRASAPHDLPETECSDIWDSPEV